MNTPTVYCWLLRPPPRTAPDAEMYPWVAVLVCGKELVALKSEFTETGASPAFDPEWKMNGFTGRYPTFAQALDMAGRATNQYADQGYTLALPDPLSFPAPKPDDKLPWRYQVAAAWHTYAREHLARIR